MQEPFLYRCLLTIRIQCAQHRAQHIGLLLKCESIENTNWFALAQLRLFFIIRSTNSDVHSTLQFGPVFVSWRLKDRRGKAEETTKLRLPSRMRTDQHSSTRLFTTRMGSKRIRNIRMLNRNYFVGQLWRRKLTSWLPWRVICRAGRTK